MEKQSPDERKKSRGKEFVLLFVVLPLAILLLACGVIYVLALL